MMIVTQGLREPHTITLLWVSRAPFRRGAKLWKRNVCWARSMSGETSSGINRKYVLGSYPVGAAQLSDFVLKEEEIPVPSEGQVGCSDPWK